MKTQANNASVENHLIRFALHVSQPKPNYNGTHGTQAFEFSIVTINGAGEVRNPSDYEPEQHPYKDLEFRCQISPADHSKFKPYGFSCEYRHVYIVDLRNAEVMCKMLKRIDKASEKWVVRPETFGQYVSLVCQSINITDAVHARDGTETGWHNDTEYIYWKAKDIQYLVDRRIAEFVEAHQERMVLAA